MAHAGGRPTKYKPEYCAVALEIAKIGGTLAMIASELDVCRDTLHEWATVHEEFSDIIKRCKTHANAFLDRTLLDNIYSERFNAAPVLFLLKCQHGYRDRDAPADIVIATTVDKDTDTDKLIDVAKRIRAERK